MPRPPAAQLTERLPCLELDNDDALQAVARAAGDSNLLVASRTGRSMVLMPCKRSNPLSCLVPVMASPSRAAADAASGAGITAELVPDEGGEGLAVSVATARTKGGEAFVAALRQHLSEQGVHGTPSVNSHVGSGKDTQTGASHFRMEAQAYYFFSKMLYDTHQEPGLAASEFMQSFADNLATMGPAAESEAMSDCTAGIDQLCRLIEKHITPSENSLRSMAPARRSSAPSPLDLQPWLRGAVERCVFSRVGWPLWRLYEEHHAVEDAQYAEKAGRLRAFSDATLLEALEVRPGLRGHLQGAIAGCGKHRNIRRGDSRSFASEEKEARLVIKDKSVPDFQDPMNSQRTPSTVASAADLSRGSQSSRRSRDAQAAYEPVCGPYDRASSALSQIELMFGKGHSCTPRELLEALTLSQLEMKTCALEASNGQCELYSMDDVMPVFIYVLASSSLVRPFACARLIGDALTKDERQEAEGRAVLLLESAARHIAFDWDISLMQDVTPRTSL